MENYKKCKVVMLATEEKATFGDIILNPNAQKLLIFQHQKCTEVKQHLYIVSDDKIENGDWCINANRDTLYQIFEEGNLEQWDKIIATTDSSLKTETSDTDIWKERKDILYPNTLPQIPQSFINTFIEEYNKGNVIEEVLVEYSFKKNIIFGNMSFVELNGDGCYYECTNCEVETSRSREFLIDHGCITDELKVNPKDNTITIKKVKDSYSREEVRELCAKAWDKSVKVNRRPGRSNGNSFNEWIEENL